MLDAGLSSPCTNSPGEMQEKKMKSLTTQHTPMRARIQVSGLPSENELVIEGDMRWDRERVIGESSQKQGIHETYIVRPETAFLVEQGWMS